MDRLRKRADFLAAQRGGRSHARAFVLQARRRDDLAAPRLGLTVTRKVGTAVERNRIRRRLRAAARLAEASARPGLDYVVVARRDAIGEPFAALASDLARAFARIPPTTTKPPRPTAGAGGAGDDRDVR